MLRILEPGLQTTVQDLGRPGLGDQGISPAGPMDPLALRLGNLLVGNPPDAAALEITLVGPTLVVENEAVIALAGAPFEAVIERGGDLTPRPPHWPHAQRAGSLGGKGEAEGKGWVRFLLPAWQAVRVSPGDVVRVRAARQGARAYLCVAGGIDVAPHLGSRATHLMAGLGGVDGRALRAGDTLPLGAPAHPLDTLAGRRLRRDLRPVYAEEVTVRVALGPQADRFTAEAQAAFLEQPYTVSPDSNRMGVRLAGPVLSHTRGADLLSEGIAFGAVQVPQSGQPIILMAERQTTGGYTKIATVIGADVGLVGQARPGSRLRFEAVSVEEALAARQAQERLVDEKSIERSAGWSAEEVTEIIQAFAASGLGELRLKTRGLRLALKRDTPSDPTPSPPTALPVREVSLVGEGGQTLPTPSLGASHLTIPAPLLGIFYTGPAPDAPPFVTPGDSVTAGQVVALIDVMKTLHEVRAPQAGRVTEILADNGTLVEYGQTLLRLEVEG